MGYDDDGERGAWFGAFLIPGDGLLKNLYFPGIQVRWL